MSKKLFIEAWNPFEQEKAINEYNKFHKEGAIFFGVAGGKLSEGVDFADSMARCVVIIGIPYPNITDKLV